MSGDLLERYREMLRMGELRPDPAQGLAVEKLQLLANRLVRYKPPARTDFFSFFTRRRGEVPKGLYIFGGVGRGKTMLMDLFFEVVPASTKRRAHFHEFMAEVHEMAARVRRICGGDPIPLLARSIAAEAHLLCLDELQVTDIADAMILGRLFAELFELNVVVVATSNVPPRELYKDGLNRNLFLPFIDLIEARMELLQLEGGHDYRLEKLSGAPLYFTPLGEAAERAVQAVWERLTGRVRGEPQSLDVMGRTLQVPEAAMGAARFRFSDLCARALGANDYLCLARHYHTLVVEGIPVMGPEMRNEARRFVNLVDALYDNRVGLVASAADEPHELYRAGDGAHLFARTASRLMEMRSEAYLSAQKQPNQPAPGRPPGTHPVT